MVKLRNKFNRTLLKSATKSKLPLKKKQQNFNFTDLPTELHQEIFRLLSLNDLLRVANANKKYAELSKWAFKQKYDEKLFLIKLFTTNVELDFEPIVELKSIIFIQNTLSLFRLLRIFGSMIKKINCYYNVQLNFIVQIKFHNYLVKYCAPTLEILILFNINKNNIFKRKTVFPNLYRLEINYGSLTKEINNLGHLFPNLSTLKILKCSIQIQTKSSLENLSKLKNLKNFTLIGHLRHNIRIDEIFENKSLENLELMHLNRTHIKKLANLTNLVELTTSADIFQFKEISYDVQFKDLIKCKIYFRPSYSSLSRFLFNSCMTTLIKLKKLEYLEYYSSENIFIKDLSLYEFFHLSQTLISIDLHIKISLADILVSITVWKKLLKFKFFTTQNEHYTLTQCLPNEWSITLLQTIEIEDGTVVYIALDKKTNINLPIQC